MFVLATLAAPAAAQRLAPAATHPDFAGTWTLVPKKSEGAGLPASMTLKVTKDSKLMTINRVGMTNMGEQRSTLIVNLDGSSTKNTVTTRGASVDLNLTQSWDGPVMVITTKATIGGQPLDQTDRWTLDSDGKVLRVATVLSGGGQTKTQTLAFEKR